MADFGEVEQCYTAERPGRKPSGACNCAGCCECLQCVKACQAGAIDHDEQEQTVELDVGAVLLTPGFEAFDAPRRGEFGFGFAANVLSNVQFERMLSASGPTQGHIRRVSDGQAAQAAGIHPVRGLARRRLRQRLLFLGLLHGRHQGGDPGQGARAGLGSDGVLPRSARFRQGFRPLLRAGQAQGVRYLRSFISRTYEMPETRNLRLVYVRSAS